MLVRYAFTNLPATRALVLSFPVAAGLAKLVTDATAAASAAAAAANAAAAAAAAGPQREHVTSPAVLGSRTLAELRAAKGRAGEYDFAGSAGPAVLDAEQQAEMTAGQGKEKNVVRIITPKLWDILTTAASVRGPAEPTASPLQLLLVNSEECRWLDHLEQPVIESMLQKPDLYVTWQPFVNFTGPGDDQGTGDNFYFGGLAHRRLQLDGVVPLILEAKKAALTNSDFGELVSYHSHLPGRVNGVLFNAEEFWLTEATNGHVSRVEKGRWAQAGTHGLLLQHFSAVLQPPPLAVLLGRLVTELNVTLVDGCSFLGAGASGRVFAVKTASGAVQALKVVATTGPLLFLKDEFSLLEAAAAKGAPVVPVVAGSLKQYPGIGGGYLMAEVGTAIKLSSQKWMRRIFGALHRVHAAGAFHGDARLPNVIKLGKKTVHWVDFVAAVFDHPAALEHAQADMKTLAASVLNQEPPAAVTAEVEAYDLTPASAKAIADAVWAAKQ